MTAGAGSPSDRIRRGLGRLQRPVVSLLRGYFARDPGWVLLTTRGRRTGLAREVPLPCGRGDDLIVVVSTYGRRADWVRNLERDPVVEVTCAGLRFAAAAEVVDDAERKLALVTAHPMPYPNPVAALLASLLPFGRFLFGTLLRPVAIRILRGWVRDRPVVVIRPLVRDRLSPPRAPAKPSGR
jgi:deazaflavin-dependent oxidoreductase (nitroreductase family)